MKKSKEMESSTFFKFKKCKQINYKYIKQCSNNDVKNIHLKDLFLENLVKKRQYKSCYPIKGELK